MDRDAAGATLAAPFPLVVSRIFAGNALG